MLAHPLGSLVGVQKVVPLGIDIDRVGRSVPSDGNRFDITGATVGIGGGGDRVGFRDEHFARGEYLDLTEEDKLSKPSFERFRAGIAVSTDDFGVPASAVAFEPRVGDRSTCARSGPTERHSCLATSLVLARRTSAPSPSRRIHADRALTGHASARCPWAPPASASRPRHRGVTVAGRVRSPSPRPSQMSGDGDRRRRSSPTSPSAEVQP